MPSVRLKTHQCPASDPNAVAMHINETFPRPIRCVQVIVFLYHLRCPQACLPCPPSRGNLLHQTYPACFASFSACPCLRARTYQAYHRRLVQLLPSSSLATPCRAYRLQRRLVPYFASFFALQRVAVVCFLRPWRLVPFACS